MTRKAMVAIVGLALLAGACVGGGDRRGRFGDGEDEDGPPRPHAQLFISPSGQPFRAAPGQPYPVVA